MTGGLWRVTGEEVRLPGHGGAGVGGGFTGEEVWLPEGVKDS
jgi:hypothetical protein